MATASDGMGRDAADSRYLGRSTRTEEAKTLQRVKYGGETTVEGAVGCRERGGRVVVGAVNRRGVFAKIN